MKRRVVEKENEQECERKRVLANHRCRFLARDLIIITELPSPSLDIEPFYSKVRGNPLGLECVRM